MTTTKTRLPAARRARRSPIAEGTRIGHVHLKVADLDRALSFYCGVLGFELTQRRGNQAAFVSAGGYHHHIGLNTWESAGGARRRPAAPGSITSPSSTPRAPRWPTRCGGVLAAGIALDGASDHGVSEALYLRDYDDNGVELYCDKPRKQWPVNDNGELVMGTHRLDLSACWRRTPSHSPSSRNHKVGGGGA